MGRAKARPIGEAKASPIINRDKYIDTNPISCFQAALGACSAGAPPTLRAPLGRPAPHPRWHQVDAYYQCDTVSVSYDTYS